MTEATSLSDFEIFFSPSTVAVLGASQDPSKYGNSCIRSLLTSGFPGRIYPINPHLKEVLSLRAYPALDAVPEAKIDLAIIVLPSTALVQALGDCARKGVRGAVIISAGFKEAEAKEGAELQKQLAVVANESGIKIIGPNTFGYINPPAHLNASFTPYFSGLPAGPLALLSQSGGVCHYLLPSCLNETIGFRLVVGLGNRANLDFADWLPVLAGDHQVRAIMMYIEGVDDPRSLVEAASRVTPLKPVVAYKVGRGSTVAKASISHTGSLAGSYAIYQGAFRQAGIISVSSMVEMFDAAKALALQPPLKGSRVAVASTVAGPGLIASDIIETGGLKMATFCPSTQAKIDGIIAPIVARRNPVDLGLIATREDLCLAVLEAILSDNGVDALLTCWAYVHEAYAMPAEGLAALARKYAKPVVVSMGYPQGSWWQKAKVILESNCIPVYPTPERAAAAVLALARYGKIWQRKIPVLKD